MSPRSETCHGRSGRGLVGFTLVEVLLVLLIVALLAGLIFPAFTSARRSARMSACTAHLRQLGMAYQLYLADYHRYPDPHRLVRSVEDRRLLFCPADRDGTDAASSYTFRTVLPPDFRPLWEQAELDPNTVLLTCTHHQERPEGRRGEARTVGDPRFPFRLVLRAGGAVERMDEGRVRELLVPGERPAYTRVYPGETGYDRAR